MNDRSQHGKEDFYLGPLLSASQNGHKRYFFILSHLTLYQIVEVGKLNFQTFNFLTILATKSVALLFDEIFYERQETN